MAAGLRAGVGAAVEGDAARASRGWRRSGAGTGWRSCRSSWPADIAPNGARHCIQPDRTAAAAGARQAAARRTSTPTPCGSTARGGTGRWPRPAWRRSPTPPGPGRSPPPLIHVGWRRSASSTAVTPPSLMPMPAGAGVGRQPVDVVERRGRRRRRRPGRRRRSATAGRPSAGGRCRSGRCRRAPTRCSKRSSVERRARRGQVAARATGFVGSRPGRREQREPHVVVLLEADRDLAGRCALGSGRSRRCWW